MTVEITILIAAQDHQTELLAEAEARRMARGTDQYTEGPLEPAKRRLAILLRRLAGAPAFA